MAELALHLHQGQSQRISPRLQKSVRLLQLPTVDFIQAVEVALGENPFLEVPDAEDAEPLPLAETGDAAEPDWGAEAFEPPVPELPERAVARNADGDTSALDWVPASTSLSAHLHQQLRLRGLPDRPFLLASLIVEALDESGFLRVPLADVAQQCDCGPLPDEDEMEQALVLVQSLDPAGVGARDLLECLRLQLPQVEPAAQRALCARILSLPLDGSRPLEPRRLGSLLQADAAEVGEALRQIRRLDCSPGARFNATPTAYIAPDVFVRKVRGRWAAVLNEALVPRVRLNEAYAQVFARHRDGASELSAQLNEARWVVRSVQQRFSTVLSVAQAILRRQQAFLEFGRMAMRPLGLSEIAQEVGVHESTVSRVTNNKYMATPFGTFEMKYFFSRGLSAAHGKTCSPTAIKGLVHDLIRRENPRQPLSDVAIAQQLHRQGIPVARRTVTKYRQQLGLRPAEERVVFAQAAA